MTYKRRVDIKPSDHIESDAPQNAQSPLSHSPKAAKTMIPPFPLMAITNLCHAPVPFPFHPSIHPFGYPMLKPKPTMK